MQTFKSPPLFSQPGVKIVAAGSYVPEKVITNAQLAQYGYDDDWILQRTGIESRCHVGKDEATSDMAYHASKSCLERAACRPEEVDLILVATLTGDHPTPATACLLQDRLGSHAAALDVNAACSGFMYGLIVGGQFVQNGVYKKVLVVGAETMSSVVNPQEKKIYPLFGDGAGAVLLEGGKQEQGLLAATLGADGSGGELLCIPFGGSRTPINEKNVRERKHYISMDGKPVFKWAVRLIEEVSSQLLGHANVKKEEVDLWLFHQANLRILNSAIEGYGLNANKVFVNVEKYGNTSAASIPLVLADAFEAGKITPGAKVVMLGFGAGLTWGGALVQF
ncbi:MAG: ketoacyl-ACP synthase III [Pirellulaceae bacterium]|nr:ketoacyl-ACP synthase III [Pirellulaceae bacterium]